MSGNHDISLDSDFYAEHGQDFHNQYPQNSQACRELLKQYRSITFLNHESMNVRLTKETGPRTAFRVFGSPYSPANGVWAFSYSPEKASEIWNGSIPLDTDVVIVHTPPKYHCDESKDHRAAGCEYLRQKLWRVRPSLVVCGHVHEGRGAERVLWDLETQNVKYKELATGYWTDGSRNSKKQSLVDLSAKSAAPLHNIERFEDASVLTSDIHMNTFDKVLLPPWGLKPSLSSNTEDPAFRASPYPRTKGADPAVWGQGGTPPSGRCDVEALAGRMGRRETCVVNAAIMASSWPYKSNKSRRYNKAIIVDIDLPAWQQADNTTNAAPSIRPHRNLTPADTMTSDQDVDSSVSN